MATKHWGEIPKNEGSDFVPDVTVDIERSMNKFCLAEFDDEEHLHKSEKIILAPMDPLMLYAISLHKYANDLTEMIRVAELATEINLIPPRDAMPSMPEPPEILVQHKRNEVNYIPKDFTPFSKGAPTEVPELNHDVVKQILAKCIVTMFAHIGYETTHQSVLDILVDILEVFLEKICHKFKVAAEDEEKGYLGGFPHTIERVLTETGLGGVKGLNDYYQCRVVKYIGVLQKRCKELNNYYSSLLIPKSPSPVEKISKVVRVKVEEEDDVMEIDNPEVHFTTVDGEVCSTLEPGYQLLNSLEAETNLQSLGETEEDIVSSSPGVGVSISAEGDISHLSPFTKKKRFK